MKLMDIVEEGNRLIQFTYEGIFEEILDQLRPDAVAAVYHTSAERTRTVIRLFTQNMTVLPQLRLQGYILHRNCFSR